MNSWTELESTDRNTLSQSTLFINPSLQHDQITDNSLYKRLTNEFNSDYNTKHNNDDFNSSERRLQFMGSEDLCPQNIHLTGLVGATQVTQPDDAIQVTQLDKATQPTQPDNVTQATQHNDTPTTLFNDEDPECFDEDSVSPNEGLLCRENLQYVDNVLHVNNNQAATNMNDDQESDDENTTTTTTIQRPSTRIYERVIQKFKFLPNLF